MKTSLLHLPLEKQNEILAITEIIKDVVNPEKIILFGSYAKGGYKEHEYTTSDGTRYEYISDYDFLVVTQEVSPKVADQESTILDRVDRYRPPVNLEIHSIDHINEGLSWGQYFFADIVQEGVLIYDSGSTSFVEPKVLTIEEEKEKAQRYYSIWFPRAQGFLKTAKFNLSEQDFKLGAFMLHQASECLYSTILLVFTGYKPKTHNLKKLRNKTKLYSLETFLIFKTEADAEEKHLFDLLKRGYIEARYDHRYSITKDELESLLRKVEELCKAVEIASKEKVASLDA
ncbi:HEPN domain-containing protein [Fulvivirgaceae bacterium PWU5]|uniref:HEPN domain-containing protein n=1 Tax=Dawidia cretensis TaxID=2782350 RepID=A0AAP2E4Y1_9BACT|nr:HEPN domain-containing protein [Dawidia cretensis]MBT1712383.1 HEPN domain-containing protein [Dawidia cretensis]